MSTLITPDRANRLAIGLAKARGIPYDQAELILKTLSIRIVAETSALQSASSQAALLTALNTAHRAFLGGVEVQIPPAVQLKLPLSPFDFLNDALAITGYLPVKLDKPSITIFIGQPGAAANDDDVILYCDGWRGGASDVHSPIDFKESACDDFALGGVFAGGMAVHRCFVKCTSLSARCLDGPFGMSLWNPTADWRVPIMEPHLLNLPTKFWLLGLGHLGQAFIWNLVLLPFPNPNDVEFLLQDYDKIDESNYGSGLLCTPNAAGARKTRHCAHWLEKFGFHATITERKFDEATLCRNDEPKIAFCGFDKASSRVYLDAAGFGLILECGLGGHLANFDQAEFHVFPNSKYSARDVWEKLLDAESTIVDPKAASLFGGGGEACGQQAIDIAGKTVSTSFVGAMCGAIAVSELLRIFNRGPHFDKLIFNARSSLDWTLTGSSPPVTATQLGKMGFCTLV